jgi:hypothetical protein
LKRRRERQAAAFVIGRALPALPVAAFGEDFSLLIRYRRLRIKRGVIRVLS